jgi:hypothetical protein
MSKTPKRSRKSAPKAQPEKKEELSHEQLDKVSGGGAVIIERDAVSLGGPDTTLGPQPHLTIPKIGQ